MRNIYHDKNNLYINVGIHCGDLTFIRSKHKQGYELEVIIDGDFNGLDMPIGIMLDEDITENKWKEYKEQFKLMGDEQRRKWTEDLVYKIHELTYLDC